MVELEVVFVIEGAEAAAAFVAVVGDEDGLLPGVAHATTGGLERLHLETERGSGGIVTVSIGSICRG